jgi:hypothetical protein
MELKMSRSESRKKQKKMIEERDRKLALKKGVTVKKLKEDRLKSNRETVATAASLLPVGGLAIKGIQGGSKLIGAAKNLLKGKDKVKKSTKVADKVKNVKTPSTSTSGAKFSQKTTKNKKPTQQTKKEKQSAVLGARKQKQTAAKKTEKKPSIIANTKNFVRKNKVPLAVGAATLGTGTALLSGSKSNKDNKKIELPKSKPKNIKPKDTKPNIIKSKPIKKTNITAGGNTGFGAKGNIFVSSEKRRKELMEKFGGTGSAAAKAAMRGTQGNMVKRAAGGLKPVPEGNKGLGKLPQPVRNKMGYMKKGGVVKMRGGGAATKGMNFNRGY